MLGTMHTIVFHRADTDVVLDSWARKTFDYVADSFTNGDATLVKNNITGTLDDSYTVKVVYEEDGEPDGSATRLDILTLAWGKVGELLADEDLPTNKIP